MGLRSVLRALVLAFLIAAIAGSGSASAARKTPPGNPPGNNGTIKIGSDADPEPNNEPHIDGCRLWLEFFGFDQDERVRITFETQPSTGKGDLLLTDERVISDDPAGGGQDEDDVVGYNLSAALQPFEPHPQQGYHIKVQSDSLNAPGGSKQKVFWLNCNPAPTGTVTVKKVTEGTGAGPFVLLVRCNHAPDDTELTLGAGDSRDITVPMGTTCAVSEPDPKGAEVRFSESVDDGKNDGQVVVTSETPAVATVTNVFPGTVAQPGTVNPPAQAAGTQVAGVTLTAPAPAPADTLPRTGTPVALLTGFGAWALGLGGLLSFAGRRR